MPSATVLPFRRPQQPPQWIGQTRRLYGRAAAFAAAALESCQHGLIFSVDMMSASTGSTFIPALLAAAASEATGHSPHPARPASAARATGNIIEIDFRGQA